MKMKLNILLLVLIVPFVLAADLSEKQDIKEIPIIEPQLQIKHLYSDYYVTKCTEPECSLYDVNIVKTIEEEDKICFTETDSLSKLTSIDVMTSTLTEKSPIIKSDDGYCVVSSYAKVGTASVEVQEISLDIIQDNRDWVQMNVSLWINRTGLIQPVETIWLEGNEYGANISEVTDINLIYKVQSTKNLNVADNKIYSIRDVDSMRRESAGQDFSYICDRTDCIYQYTENGVNVLFTGHYNATLGIVYVDPVSFSYNLSKGYFNQTEYNAGVGITVTGTNTTGTYFSEVEQLDSSYNMVNQTSTVNCNGLDCLMHRHFLGSKYPLNDTRIIGYYGFHNGVLNDYKNLNNPITIEPEYTSTEYTIPENDSVYVSDYYPGGTVKKVQLKYSSDNAISRENNAGTSGGVCVTYKLMEGSWGGAPIYGTTHNMGVVFGSWGKDYRCYLENSTGSDYEFYAGPGGIRDIGIVHTMCCMLDGTEAYSVYDGTEYDRGSNTITGGLGWQSQDWYIGQTYGNSQSCFKNITVYAIVFFNDSMEAENLNYTKYYTEYNGMTEYWEDTAWQTTTNGTNILNQSIKPDTNFIQSEYLEYKTSPTSNILVNFSTTAYNFTAGNVTPENDSCTYSGSGDWIITDNCILDVNTDIRPNSIIVRSPYYINVQAEILTGKFYLDEPGAKMYGMVTLA